MPKCIPSNPLDPRHFGKQPELFDDGGRSTDSATTKPMPAVACISWERSPCSASSTFFGTPIFHTKSDFVVPIVAIANSIHHVPNLLNAEVWKFLHDVEHSTELHESMSIGFWMNLRNPMFRTYHTNLCNPLGFLGLLMVLRHGIQCFCTNLCLTGMRNCRINTNTQNIQQLLRAMIMISLFYMFWSLINSFNFNLSIHASHWDFPWNRTLSTMRCTWSRSAHTWRREGCTGTAWWPTPRSFANLSHTNGSTSKMAQQLQATLTKPGATSRDCLILEPWMMRFHWFVAWFWMSNFGL